MVKPVQPPRESAEPADATTALFLDAERAWQAQVPKPLMPYARFREMAVAIEQVFELRRLQAGVLAHQGKEPETLIMCLGPGRCLYATDLANAQVCPFCARCDDQRYSPMQTARLVAFGH